MTTHHQPPHQHEPQHAPIHPAEHPQQPASPASAAWPPTPPQPSTQPKNTVVWKLLCILPPAVALFIILTQTVIQLITDRTAIDFSAIETLTNILSILIGIPALIMTILLPLWIALLAQAVDHNNQLQFNKGVFVRKYKTPAVVLAACFGMFTWTYTLKKDAHKFWISIAIAATTFGAWIVGAWLWAVIEAATRDEYFYATYYYPEQPPAAPPSPPTPPAAA